VEAVPEPARRQQDERRDHERRYRAENEQRLEHTAAPGDGPQVRGRRRHEHDRIELRGHRQPEQAEGEQVPPTQERSQRAGGQRGRKQVVGVE
jgi:hypothetical protein